MKEAENGRDAPAKRNGNEEMGNGRLTMREMKKRKERVKRKEEGDRVDGEIEDADEDEEAELAMSKKGVPPGW